MEGKILKYEDLRDRARVKIANLLTRVEELTQENARLRQAGIRD